MALKTEQNLTIVRKKKKTDAEISGYYLTAAISWSTADDAAFQEREPTLRMESDKPCKIADSCYRVDTL